MRIILLSGGSGKRLWPLSNDTRSKQFLKLLRAPNGANESMVQRVYRQIREAGIDAPITIATSASQSDSIANQLGASVDTVLEPERRDTFPAIALSAVYLALEQNCPVDEVVVVLPVDPCTELGYFKTLLKMESAIKSGIADLLLMGITPTYASEKYGYIVPEQGQDQPPYTVARFTEKPSEDGAKKLLAENAYWNGGTFAFKLGYLMDIVRKYTKPSSFQDMHSRYAELPNISFDYEVVEKARSVAMIPFSGQWKDLGTWNTLTEELQDECAGVAVTGENSKNVHIINELDIPIVALGLKDVIIAASPDGILVSDKTASAQLKGYIGKIEQRPMYEKRRWGEYKVLDYNTHHDDIKSLTKRLCIQAGKSLSYQEHHLRDEIWTIIDGTGDLLLDGHVRNVRRGDVAYITAGMKHSMRATSDLCFIEVQIGKELVETDIVRIDYDW